jgi:AcrR family transcriptional regulator
MVPPYVSVWHPDKVSSSPSSAPLGPTDWVGAALVAVAEGGITNISVERLARSLGATKGSFYWHFKDRPALVAATLDAWAGQTEAIIARVETLDDARARLDHLFASVLETGSGGRVELALLADADDPVVAAAIDEVMARRLGFLQLLFEQLGKDEPADRALLAYTCFVGLLQLRRAAPETVPSGDRLLAFVEHLTERLLR